MGDTIEGRLVGITGKAAVGGVEVWFAYVTNDGRKESVKTRSGPDGTFRFDVPPERLDKAGIGAHPEGVTAVDLKPRGQRLKPGDVTLLVDDIVPSFLRYS